MSFKVSSRGFSIIGSLLGFSLVGLSTIGLATYMGSFESVRVSYSRQANINFMHSELLGGMEKIIIMTETDNRGLPDTSGKKYGLCQMITHQDNSINYDNDNKTAVNYDNIKEKSICPVLLRGSAIRATSVADYYNAPNRWKYFIEQGKNWKISSSPANDCGKDNGFIGSFSEDAFNKCVKYIGRTEQTGIYARLMMMPERLPGFKKISDNNSDIIPVDELVYKFQSVISVRKELEPGNVVYSLSKGEKYLWSTEVLDCDVCESASTADGQCKRVRFSTASQGTATRYSRICYHSSYETKEQKDEDALKITVEKIPPEFEKNTNQISAKSSQGNYSSSCHSRLFRCGDTVNRNDFDPALKFQFLLDFDHPDDSFINEIDLKISDGAFLTPTVYSHGTVFIPSNQKARVGSKKDGTSVTYSDKKWPLKSGSDKMTVFMADRKGSDSLCENICLSSDSYYPQLTVEYGGDDCDGGSRCSKLENFSSKPIACFRCNMKSCHRFGVGTHALANASRAAEPLDGIIPECVIENTINTNPDETQITSGAGDVNNKCLKTAAGGRLKAVSCGTAGPGGAAFTSGSIKSACFVEGKTRVLEGGYSGLEAWDNCLQILKEHQLIGTKDAQGVWKTGILPKMALAYHVSPSGDRTNPGVKQVLENTGGLTVRGSTHYSFKNYARFATFFGDHADVGEADVFVPFQRDASGMFHSGWLAFQDLFSSGSNEEKNRWAFFYRESFNSINFHDLENRCRNKSVPLVGSCRYSSGTCTGSGGATCTLIPYPKREAAITPAEAKKRFLKRVRPTRPVYIKMDADFHPDYPGTKQVNSTPSDLYLALTHHLVFKGIRPVQSPSSNEYPYLCRNIKADTYKDAFVTTKALGQEMDTGYDNCSALGSDWYFIPPDTREFWASALQAVVPNAPRYPFPNPFKFVDGIPFWKDKGDLKKRSWELSYNYKDMPGASDSSDNDYLKSEAMDNLFFFDKDTLASPETAWIGGLKPVDATGGSPEKSWEWKPDWEKILGSSFTPGTDSLFFDERQDADRMNDVMKDLDDPDDLTNIGGLDNDGRVMGLKALRVPGPLNNFKNKSVKLCRYGGDVKELDFHRALIIAYREAHWPSKDKDKCSEFSSADSESFLDGDINGVYFKIPDNPGKTGLSDLTGQDFIDISQGIRTLIPLLSYHKEGAMYIRNTDKFCRLWKREKKRRAVGNCIVKNYNESTLVSKDGTRYGLGVSRDYRRKNECHRPGYNCSLAEGHFQNQYDALILEQTQVSTDRANAKNREAEITNTLIPRYEDIRDNGTGCPACVGSDCTARNTCKRDGGAEVVRLEGEKGNLTTQIRDFDDKVGELEGYVTCATDTKLADAKNKTKCIDSMTDVDRHTYSYSPEILDCSSAHFSALDIDFNNPDIDRRCHSLETLDPEHQFKFNDGKKELNGIVGVLGGDSFMMWDADADCNRNASRLHKMKPHCNGKYAKPVDLDNRFCDDDGIDYDSETCMIL